MVCEVIIDCQPPPSADDPDVLEEGGGVVIGYEDDYDVESGTPSEQRSLTQKVKNYVVFKQISLKKIPKKYLSRIPITRSCAAGHVYRKARAPLVSILRDSAIILAPQAETALILIQAHKPEARYRQDRDGRRTRLPINFLRRKSTLI